MIDLESDGCEFSEWEQLSDDRLFARHPDGFKIFLKPDRITDSDEYAESDPYKVEESIDSAFHTRRFELTIDMIESIVSSGTQQLRILDIGCGEGHITEAIRQKIPGSNVTGLDYSISAIKYAHRNFPNIEFVVGDAYNCPYPDGYFDAVVCNNLWEHVPDPLYLLSVVRRVVKPGGHIVISTPSRYRLGNLFRVLRGKKVAFMSHHHVTEYSVGQVKEQLKYGGFAVTKVMSRKISQESVLKNIFKFFVSFFSTIVGSHHELEATVFYLAKDTGKEPSQSAAQD